MDKDVMTSTASSSELPMSEQFALAAWQNSHNIHSTAMRLPYECLLQIFTYMELDSLGVCAQVCRSWNITASDYHLWQDLNLSGILPRRLRGSAQTSFCHFQMQRYSKKVVVKNPYYLSGSDITTLVRTLGNVSRCGEQQNSGNKSSQESPLEVLQIENYSQLDCTALSMSLSNDDLLTYNIHTLSFHGTHIDSSVIGAICNSPSLRAKLTSMDLAFSGLESEAVYMIADRLENLYSLSLAGNLAVCSTAVEYLLLRLGHVITNLDLRFIWGLEASWFVDYFTASIHGVKVLDIRGCEHFNKRNVRDLLAVSPDTKILNSVVLEDDSVEGYRHFVQLLASASITDDGEPISQCAAINIKQFPNNGQFGGITTGVFGSYESSNADSTSSASGESEDAEDYFDAFY
ncbi:hypothetical protein POJ06DRAFT_246376 [Lipomyces tetrasporus]|uniref:F-box domain-containing protein n=1 Tax=Lipomyces tetrasporus TaxID=54092 RepID=A0AAD7QX82_9ASCO|nr:uncharacterized protein POJ06DRAFT_246376 [Lipomyces tetrasporus]KAJ8103035.1 hypothetical protein POJ06DRAFT_246376 [Lipomyces tetrasporus]